MIFIVGEKTSSSDVERGDVTSYFKTGRLKFMRRWTGGGASLLTGAHPTFVVKRRRGSPKLYRAHLENDGAVSSAETAA